ncbi:MAG TPA: nucleoside 2-deoxyribosyltransferase [Candidatus Norongarragalinales archaeon]|jgi:hypothetical protein|nr:nucleoside 2-deoxyribosyltransferase [Candidatus Norongarragalinales archaeon]
MNIYFAGSIRGGRSDKEAYLKIINKLSGHGKVLTEHIGDQTLTDQGEIDKTDDYIFKRDTEWIKQADVVVAEVTAPSLGVGLELALAEKMNKKVLCLYRKIEGARLSAMVAGNDYFQKQQYENVDDLDFFFDGFFKKP